MDNLISELLKILQDKKQSLNKISELTTFQTSAIEKGKDKKLQRLIDEKQKYIDGIDKLDEEFIQKFKELKIQLGINEISELKHTSDPLLKDLKDEVNNIFGLTQEILAKEKSNSVKVKEEFDDIKGKLKEISGGKKAISAYGGYNKPSSGGVFIDNKK